MKKKLLVVGLFSMAFFQSNAQLMEGFESMGLPIDTAVKYPSNNQNDFIFGSLTLSNSYNASWDSYTGFAFSTITDNQTAGWENQFGTITGSGADGSAHFAVLYDQGTIFGQTAAVNLDSLEISNSTYAYFSMLNGDQFAKKFGGVSGDDPDFLKLNILASSADGVDQDTISFYLADYRFDDNTQDYIVNNWTTIDLSTLSFPVNQVEFFFESSDTSAGWINTPTYANLDNIYYSSSASLKENTNSISVFPNPFSDIINIQGEVDLIRIADLSGRIVFENADTLPHLNLSELENGIYVLVTEKGGVSSSVRIEKR